MSAKEKMVDLLAQGAGPATEEKQIIGGQNHPSQVTSTRTVPVSIHAVTVQDTPATGARTENRYKDISDTNVESTRLQPAEHKPTEGQRRNNQSETADRTHQAGKQGPQLIPAKPATPTTTPDKQWMWAHRCAGLNFAGLSQRENRALHAVAQN